MKNKFGKSALKEDLVRALANSKNGSVIGSNNSFWKAFDLAYSSHEGQFREPPEREKDAIPYITHPVGVAKKAIELWMDGELADDFETVLSLCLLHDVLEDTAVEYATLEQHFGRRLASLCEALTKPPRVQGQTRAERNEAATDKILSAGTTAIFVKACDALHNISRPSSMPLSLLQKTIEKVSGPYSRLIANQPFEPRVSEAYSIALSRARTTLSAAGNFGDGVPTESLEDLLAHISKKTKSKVFEEHDVLGFFLSLPGVKSAFIGFKEQVSSNFSHMIGSGKLTSLHSRLPNSDVPIAVPIEPNPAAGHLQQKVIVCRFLSSFVASDKRSLFVLIDSSECPEWFQPNTISVILKLLTQRLVAQLRDRSLETASLISFHKLDLDVREAIHFGLEAADVIQLEEIVRFSGEVSDYLLVELKSAGLTQDDSRKIEKFETRKKSLASALRKLQNRSIDDIGSLDDLVGFRFVLLSKTHCIELSEEVAEFLSGQGQRGSRFDLQSDNAFQPIRVQSNHGYSAIHIGFRIRGYARNGEALSIGCEVQIRTIAEDAVARILHELTYKKSPLTKSAKRTLEKRLSSIREEIDTIVNLKM